MTAPNRPNVDGLITSVSGLQGLQRVTDESLKAQMRAPLESAFGKAQADFAAGLKERILDPLKLIFRGVRPAGFEDVAQAFQDGQAALVGRLDLLEGIHGYCSAYMSKNINGEWGTDNTRMLPFDAPLGPSKGAHVDATKGGIVMDEPGLWTVSMMCTARWTAHTSSWLDTDSVRATLRVHAPDGSVYSETLLQYLSGKSAVTPTVSIPVVVPAAGYYTSVEAYSSRWRWWDGGTRFSRMAVLKHDSSVVNPGQATVPDETQP